MSNTIMKEIRIHIKHNKTWVEYETKSGRIGKIETNGIGVAADYAVKLVANAERWTEE